MVRTIVNQSPQAEVAVGVHARIAQACQRFLGMRVHDGGSVPWDSAVAMANREGKPLVLANPAAPAAAAIERIAEQVLSPHKPNQQREAIDNESSSEPTINNIAA